MMATLSLRQRIPLDISVVVLVTGLCVDAVVLWHDYQTLCRDMQESSARLASTLVQALETENFTATEALGWVPDPTTGNETGLRDYLADCERWYILRALEQCLGRIGETADLLGISRKGLWERMNRLAIERPEPGAIQAQH